MAFSWFSKEKLFPILINRTAIVSFILCLITLIFYADGTVKGAIDSTQLSILSFYAIPGIFLGVISITGVILALRRFMKTWKFRCLSVALVYLLLAAFGVITVLAAKFIIILTAGNGVS